MTAIYGGEAWKFGPGSSDLPSGWRAFVSARDANGNLLPGSPGYPSDVRFKAGDADVKICDLRSPRGLFAADHYWVVIWDGRSVARGDATLKPEIEKVCIWVYVENGKVCTAWGRPYDCPERLGKIEICNV